MERVTPKVLKQVRQDIKDALASVEDKHGIVFDFNNISYGDDHFSLRLKANVGSDVSEIAKKDWNKYAVLFGLTEDDFGATFKYGGETYKIVGIKPRSKKYPLIVENEKGKKYKMPVDAFK